MTVTFQKSCLIATKRAADTAHTAILAWAASHATKGSDQAKRTLSPRGVSSDFQEGPLHLTAVKTPNEDLPSQSAMYCVHYQTDSTPTPYAGYALVIYPNEEANSSGVISITLHEPHLWGPAAPPWDTQPTQPRDQLDTIIENARQQDRQNHRRRRRSSQPAAQMDTLRQAQETYGPVILLTPRGGQDRTISDLVNQYIDSVHVNTITDAQQLSMSQEIPDDWLRRWLSAKAVLVKDCYEAVSADHPLTTLDTPQDLQPLLEAFQEEMEETTELMALRCILQNYMRTLMEYNNTRDILRQTARSNPEAFQKTLSTYLAKADTTVATDPSSPPSRRPPPPRERSPTRKAPSWCRPNSASPPWRTRSSRSSRPPRTSSNGSRTCRPRSTPITSTSPEPVTMTPSRMPIPNPGRPGTTSCSSPSARRAGSPTSASSPAPPGNSPASGGPSPPPRR